MVQAMGSVYKTQSGYAWKEALKETQRGSMKATWMKTSKSVPICDDVERWHLVCMRCGVDIMRYTNYGFWETKDGERYASELVLYWLEIPYED